MANNRLYIVDTETGEQFMLAKSYGEGWYFWAAKGAEARVYELDQWLQRRDLDASYGNTNAEPSKLRLVTENEMPNEPPLLTDTMADMVERERLAQKYTEEREHRERAVINAAKLWRQSKSNIDAALLDMAVAELVAFETEPKDVKK